MKPKEFLITKPDERIWANCKFGTTPKIESKKTPNTIAPDTITYVFNITSISASYNNKINNE